MGVPESDEVREEGYRQLEERYPELQDDVRANELVDAVKAAAEVEGRDWRDPAFVEEIYLRGGW